MWKDFFAAGGWGMYPVSFFGFLLIAASVLYELRPQRRTGRLVLALGISTFAAGLLGTLVGICNSFLYIPQVPEPKQLETMALGVEESLHNAVLALILIVLAGIVSAAGSLRASSKSTPAT